VDFYHYFLDQMKKWGNSYPCTNNEFWKRLHGENKYALKQFRPDKQVAMREKGLNNPIRRTQLNYCWNIFRTLEVRLFPLFTNKDTAISALKACIHCFETYLKNNSLKEEFMKADLLENECESIKQPTQDNINEILAKMDSISRALDVEENPLIKSQLTLDYIQLRNDKNCLQTNIKKKSPFVFNFFEEYDPNINAHPQKTKEAKIGGILKKSNYNWTEEILTSGVLKEITPEQQEYAPDKCEQRPFPTKRPDDKWWKIENSPNQGKPVKDMLLKNKSNNPYETLNNAKTEEKYKSITELYKLARANKAKTNPIPKNCMDTNSISEDLEDVVP